jgi:hypothetical protein
MSDDKRPRSGPVVIELHAPGSGSRTADAAPQGPAEAPPITDSPEQLPSGQAMQVAARLGARRASPLARLFWGSAGALVVFVTSLAAWDYVTSLLARSPTLGAAATALLALLVHGTGLAGTARGCGIRQNSTAR